MFHEATQKTDAFYRRFVPAGSDGKRAFSAIQVKRLEKLGLGHKSGDPDSLTDEERDRFVRLDIDPATITWNRVIDTNDR